MSSVSNGCPLLRKKMLSAYRNGLSPSKICLSLGLSERNYFDIVKRYPDEFKRAKKMRIMNQKKNRDRLKTRLHGGEVKVNKAPKITLDEKLTHLEKRLEAEQKKNKELEELLKIAKEQLGKL